MCVFSLTVLTVLTLAGDFVGAADAKPGHKIFRTIMLITVKFIPAARETPYFFSLVQRDLSGTFREPTSVEWTRQLELVDKAGPPNPGTPGSKAAVDSGCTNAGVGVSKPEKVAVNLNEKTYQFVWLHPDAANSVPPGRYHCKHLATGPRGHRGLVSVIVTGKGWEGTEGYKGTNSSAAKGEAETLRGVVKDLTASYLDCVSVG
jgi:hypothetical protein